MTNTSAERPPPQYPIESVDRTLQLLELLGAQQEIRLVTVRDQLGIGQSTAHRLMAMLVYRGFAEQNPQSRAYRAGPTLIKLGRAVTDERDIVEIARTALERLAADSGETVHLSVLTGTEIRYLDGVDSEAPLRVASRVGHIGPAHATSVGKAMLATLDDAELSRRYAGTALPPSTPRTLTTFAELMAEIGRTRKRGWGRNREEMENGVCSVGCAIVHPVLGLVAGLSIATPKFRSKPAVEREHAGLLRVAAARLVVTMDSAAADRAPDAPHH